LCITVRVIQITPTNHLLTALAIADLLTMVSYLPYAVYFYCVTVPDPSYGHPAGWVVYLLFNIYFTITTHTAAMWLTVALAVFRYVVVCCHQALGARLCTLQRAKVRNIPGNLPIVGSGVPQKLEALSDAVIRPSVCLSAPFSLLRTARFRATAIVEH